MTETTNLLARTFEKEIFSRKRKIKLLSHRCVTIKNLEDIRYITWQKWRSADYNRKKMMRNYSLNIPSEATMEEFKNFLISVKSALDSVANEIKIVYLLDTKNNFDLYGFLEALAKTNRAFAVNIGKLCQKGEKNGWFEYFLELRNPETHTGKITPSFFITIKPTRDHKIEVKFKKIEGEIPDPLAEVKRETPRTRIDPDIQEMGIFLPDNPKEIDRKKITYNRQIKFTDFNIDLTNRINLLLKECYQQIGNEVDQIEVSIHQKLCTRTKCKNRNCKFRK